MLAEHTTTNRPGNPTTEVVMQRIVDAIKAGCAYEIDEDAERAFRRRYTPSFDAKLQIWSWAKAEQNVLRSAHNHGVIAQSIAALRQQDRVDKDAFMTAGLIVQENCRITYQELIWCQGPYPADE